MKVDKSLQEVWDWKEKVYQETKGLSIKKAVENIHKGSDEFCKRYGFHFKILHQEGSKTGK